MDADVEVSESEIEDIFAQYPRFLGDLLGVRGELRLLGRQTALESGRLDLMYACLSNLLLVELKVERFRIAFVKQILRYRDELLALQANGQFIRGEIVSYLLCPGADQVSMASATAGGVRLVSYDPGDILSRFYQSAPLDTKYLSVRPSDKGVWRIALCNQALYLAAEVRRPAEIARRRDMSVKTITNQFRLAEDLGLVRCGAQQVELTTQGEKFVRLRDVALPPDVLSVEQADLLRSLILTDPFFSGATFGIVTMIGCVFELSKNTYPVPRALLSPHFINACGLHFRWSTDRAINKGVRMYSNYAIELGLVGKIGDSYFVTPSGLSFVLLLNMHKSLKFLESVKAIN